MLPTARSMPDRDGFMTENEIEFEFATTFAGAPDEIPLDLQAKVALIRGVEERFLKLFSEGKIFGTVHTCIGQEWTGVAIAEALLEQDNIFTSHRGHGHY